MSLRKLTASQCFILCYYISIFPYCLFKTNYNQALDSNSAKIKILQLRKMKFKTKNKGYSKGIHKNLWKKIVLYLIKCCINN